MACMRGMHVYVVEAEVWTSCDHCLCAREISITVQAHVLHVELIPFMPSYFDGTRLPYTDTFKYLGVVCDRTFNLNVAAEYGSFEPVCS